jgi:hypothetical protein
MGTFAEIADVDYRLPFANQGRQISISRFRLQQRTENRRPGDFPQSVYHLLILQTDSLSFVPLLTKKQMEIVCLQTD